MLYHQATTNQTKINELKIILCYKCELMRPSKGIINLANLRTMFGYLFKESEFTANAKTFNASVSMHNSHAKISHVLYAQQFFLPTFDISSQDKCQPLF